VCDLAYMIQVEQIERGALAELVLAPHLKEGAQLTTPEQAVAEFDAWLTDQPDNDMTNPADLELTQLIRGK
jgi:hypothetical protein